MPSWWINQKHEHFSVIPNFGTQRCSIPFHFSWNATKSQPPHGLVLVSCIARGKWVNGHGSVCNLKGQNKWICKWGIFWMYEVFCISEFHPESPQNRVTSIWTSFISFPKCRCDWINTPVRASTPLPVERHIYLKCKCREYEPFQVWNHSIWKPLPLTQSVIQ